MSEPLVETRAHSGTAEDRVPPPPRIANTAAGSLASGLGIAWIHFLISCFHSGAFVYHPIPSELLDVTYFAILPTLHLLGRIVNNQLAKAAGDDK